MSSYDAWDAQTGEGLTESELEERYDDYLDEVVGEIEIGSLTYLASRVLQEVDPIAYRVGFSDWMDAEISDGNLLEEEPTDEDDEDEEGEL